MTKKCKIPRCWKYDRSQWERTRRDKVVSDPELTIMPTYTAIKQIQGI